MLLLDALACVEGEDPPDDTAPADSEPSDTSPEVEGRPPEDLVFRDANNYAYSGILDGPTFRTRSQADVTLDWSTMTKDLQCHDVDPVADIDNLALLAFPLLSEVEVEEGLSAGTLLQADLGGYVSFAVGDQTSAHLSDLTFFGTEVNIELELTEGAATWLLIVTTGDTVGVGSRSMIFLEPDDDETNTAAAFTDSCEILDFSADLSALSPLPARVEGPWRLDWSGLTRNGLGGPIELGNIDQVMVGRYEGRTPEDLAAQFLDLELIATELWTWDLDGGATFDLAEPTLAGGDFPGLTGEGTWILALRSSFSPNPAPLFLTVLAPG